MSENPTAGRIAGYDGRSVVLFVYVVVVAIAGCWGYLLGALGIQDLQSVSLFFLFEIQPTPVGLAVYGMLTLGVGLGVVLLAVGYVSRHYTA
ncbi:MULTISPECIES: DUF7520 family protein [Halococcus]|uniref:DUF7520 family protein n=1 Tax=Halococcus TaxID=2249 RepID=UPI000E7593D0|nr:MULTISPECIES: cox cluster protein [Halococcus]RJT02538.1 cox cluster protein [Halococcus sp. IIIV-5B]